MLGIDPPTKRDRVRRWGPSFLLLVALAIVSAAVVPRIQADGDVRSTTLDLDASEQTPGLRIRGELERNIYGFVLPAFSSGRASFSIPPPAVGGDERTVLFVTAGAGDGVSIELSLVDSLGRRHLLGRPENWLERRVDITDVLQGNQARLEFSATSRTSSPQLVADQVRTASYQPEAVPRASRWEVSAWVALVVFSALALLGRIRQGAVLAIAAGLTAFLVWPSVKSEALGPLFSDLWQPAVDAKWVDLEQGLLSGTFGHRSHLAVQLFHLLTPLTGTGVAGARVASMFVGIAAVIAIYMLGRRVAGHLGAVAAATCALLSDPFRLSLSTGDSTGTLVLAASVFLIATHRVLLRGDREAIVALGAAGALAILAEPTWWPGVVAATILLSFRFAPEGTAWRAVAVVLLTLVVISLPARISVAHQSAGELNADVIERATRARNIEFVGRGHGAPPDRDALAARPADGPKVGLAEYVLGDHSLTVVMGGALSGGYDGLAAAAARPDTKLVGLVAFVIQLAGVVFLLLIPRLRLLVLTPAAVALVPWFFASRDAVPAFSASTAFWPALLVGAAAVAYAAREAVRRRVGGSEFAARLVSRPIRSARRVLRRRYLAKG